MELMAAPRALQMHPIGKVAICLDSEYVLLGAKTDWQQSVSTCTPYTLLLTHHARKLLYRALHRLESEPGSPCAHRFHPRFLNSLIFRRHPPLLFFQILPKQAPCYALSVWRPCLIQILIMLGKQRTQEARTQPPQFHGPPAPTVSALR